MGRVERDGTAWRETEGERRDGMERDRRRETGQDKEGLNGVERDGKG